MRWLPFLAPVALLGRGRGSPWNKIDDSRLTSVGSGAAAVAAAFGGSVSEVFGRWHSWAAGQRDVLICGKPGVTAEDYETAARVFAAADVTVPGEKPRRD